MLPLACKALSLQHDSTVMSKRKRQFSAWLLLAIFVSTTALSALHIHTVLPASETVCTDCQHHVSHTAHLSTAATPIDHCVLCQFRSLPMLFAVAPLMIVSFAPQPSTFNVQRSILNPQPSNLHPLRAPPVVF